MQLIIRRQSPVAVVAYHQWTFFQRQQTKLVQMGSGKVNCCNVTQTPMQLINGLFKETSINMLKWFSFSCKNFMAVVIQLSSRISFVSFVYLQLLSTFHWFAVAVIIVIIISNGCWQNENCARWITINPVTHERFTSKLCTLGLVDSKWTFYGFIHWSSFQMGRYRYWLWSTASYVK